MKKNTKTKKTLWFCCQWQKVIQIGNKKFSTQNTFREMDWLAKIMVLCPRNKYLIYSKDRIFLLLSLDQLPSIKCLTFHNRVCQNIWKIALSKFLLGNPASGKLLPMHHNTNSYKLGANQSSYQYKYRWVALCKFIKIKLVIIKYHYLLV